MMKENLGGRSVHFSDGSLVHLGTPAGNFLTPAFRASRTFTERFTIVNTNTGNVISTNTTVGDGNNIVNNNSDPGGGTIVNNNNDGGAGSIVNNNTDDGGSIVNNNTDDGGSIVNNNDDTGGTIVNNNNNAVGTSSGLAETVHGLVKIESHEQHGEHSPSISSHNNIPRVEPHEQHTDMAVSVTLFLLQRHPEITWDQEKLRGSSRAYWSFHWYTAKVPTHYHQLDRPGRRHLQQKLGPGRRHLSASWMAQLSRTGGIQLAQYVGTRTVDKPGIQVDLISTEKRKESNLNSR
ncbi:hypothetical protein B0H16DRAFT_1844276 [Mycena metata]|uniref:Uncharacterized protein n=1 Tax=Mycena metata TaxID=1033252 RepID=A0AAD7IT44_9AGAR|nr:hypothetical protein B0H16DRAFT_1844276 [Mycena metata]